MDIDNNGKISFEEFYDWWFHGKKNKLKPLVYAKMVAYK
jgi:flavodoxin